jgi:hypothetical protein
MNPENNKSQSGYYILQDDWIALATVLDQIAIHHLKDAPAGCASHILALRLRAVADFARDPYNEAKIK